MFDASSPLVSVIIPAYNCEAYVAAAIRSALEQTYSTLEVIVVDDGSSDATAKEIKAFSEKVTLVSRENGGISAARNSGIHVAKGEFYAFLDADDLWLPEKIQQQVDALCANTDLEGVFCLSKNFISPDVADSFTHDVSDEVMVGHIPSFLCIRRESFNRVGPFDESVKRAEFIDWYSRALDLGIQFSTVNTLLGMRRLHRVPEAPASGSASSPYLLALKRSLDRKRESQRTRKD